MDLGFEQAGFKISWANDNDEDSVATYRLNLGEHCVLGDVRRIDFSQIPYSDGIIGGFPCQGFSIANTGRKVDDSRNLLYRSFVKALKICQPKFFLAENVKGILSLGKGSIFKHIVQQFEAVGYNCSYALVNAADYGVPQTRQRVLILGTRADLNKIDWIWPPPPTHVGKWISVGEALRDIPEPNDTHDFHNHVHSAFKLKFNGYISNRFTEPSKPAPTVTARGDNKGGAMIMHHPLNHRRMTCRELARVQGFPDDFKFVGTMTSVYRQIGNAVPPPLAHAAAKQILRIFS